MTFDHPALLALALLLPILAVVLVVLGVRRRRARLARLGKGPAVERLIPVSSRAPAWPRATRLGGALLFAGAALAGPRWGAERGVVRGEGIDVVLALDASNSMLATDERPNRLERMKQEVRRLRSLAPGDRVALVAFAGRSYILTPLTVDDSALELFLDNLDPSVVGQSGSSLSRAIGQATDLLLSTKTASDRAIVLMSDGEAFETAAEIETAARRAREEGITLVTVGFGTPRGATIPEPQPNGSVAAKRDEEGNVVVTRYSPDKLRAAAEAAGGTFIEASVTDKAARVRAALRGLRAQERATQTGASLRPRFQLLLLPAVLLLALDTLLAGRTRRRRSPVPAATPAAAAGTVALLLLLGGPGTAAAADPAVDAAAAYRAGQFARAVALYRQAVTAGDRSPETLYNLGTALLAADSAAAAAEPLERAVAGGAGDVRFRALFNLGLSQLRRGSAAPGDSGRAQLDAALASYKQALLMRPADGDAKWNYELALQKKQQGGGGGGGGNNNDEQSPNPEPRPKPPTERPSGALTQQQADQLLNSAASDEKAVQSKHQPRGQNAPPPGTRDW
jgi:Ca-activated chloride channel family protein